MLNLNAYKRTGYLYKIGLALNNLQKLICHRTRSTDQPTNQPENERCRDNKNVITEKIYVTIPVVSRREKVKADIINRLF